MSDTVFSTRRRRWRPGHLAAAAILAAGVLFGAGGARAQASLGEGGAAAEASKALFEAVFNNDLDGVKLSVARGADIEARRRLNRSALELAIDLGHFKIAHYLLALRHHKKVLAQSAKPPPPAPAPPFVPLDPALAPTAPSTTVARAALTATQPRAEAPEAVAAAPEAEVASTAPDASPREPVTVASPPPPAPEAAVQAAPPQPPETAVQAAPPPPPEAAVPAAPPPPPAPKAAVPAAPPPPPETAVAVAATTPRPESREPSAEVALGLSLRLGQGVGEAGASGDCVEKRGGAVRYCVVPADWPAALEPYFLVDGFLYRGVKALVRFDGGGVTHLYAQFAAESFAAVADYHKRLLGSPSETIEHETRLAEGGTAANQVLVWRWRDSAGGSASILEIRNYDDVRRAVAPARYGVIRAYYEGSTALFAHLSALDLMRLR